MGIFKSHIRRRMKKDGIGRKAVGHWWQMNLITLTDSLVYTEKNKNKKLSYLKFINLLTINFFCHFFPYLCPNFL